MVDGDRPVRMERSGPVVRLTIDSPANANALSVRVLSGLLEAVQACRADPDVRAVVLTAAGPTFCAGADMAERLRPAEPGAVTIAQVLNALHRLSVPVIARVQGHVRGGGTGLVAVADLAVATGQVTFAFSEARLGVAPAVVAVPVLQRMNRRSFERYALTGDVFSAAEAAAAGLLTAVVDDEPALDAWVDAVLGSVLRCSPQALAATKSLPARCAAPWADAMEAVIGLSDSLFSSPAGVEGMTAFFEKRPPSWLRPWPAAPAATAAPEGQ